MHPYTNFLKGPSQRQSGREVADGQCIEETSFQAPTNGISKKPSRNRQNLSISTKVTRFRHKDIGKGPQKNGPVKAGMKEAVGKKQERRLLEITGN